MTSKLYFVELINIIKIVKYFHYFFPINILFFQFSFYFTELNFINSFCQKVYLSLIRSIKYNLKIILTKDQPKHVLGPKRKLNSNLCNLAAFSRKRNRKCPIFYVINTNKNIHDY